jgi:hypothetical protein
MSTACIFQKNCRDNSDKDSRALRETHALEELRKKNPKVMVLNKRGRAATPAQKKQSGASTDKQLPKGFIGKKLAILREQGRMESGFCTHNPAQVVAALKTIYGDSSCGSMEVVREQVIYQNTIVAAYSGYYQVDGETVYLHSDGSLCRIGNMAASETPPRCSCRRVH